MSKKNKKFSKREQAERRLREVKKAEGSVLFRHSYDNSVKHTNENQVSVNGNQEVLNKFNLPIAEIKRDLWKNLIYAVFSVVLVIVLKFTLKV